MFAHHRLSRRRATAYVAWVVCSALALTACGQPQPTPLPALQSPIQPTATLPGAVATGTPPPAPPTQPLPPPTSVGPPPVAPTTATPLFVPTVERTPGFLPTPFGTPDTQGTSIAVAATLTALAAPPTNPPQVTRRPVGDGPDVTVQVVRTATPTLDPSGVSLLSLSDRVYPGGAVALTIRTQPSAACTLQTARAQGDGSQKLDPVPGGASRQAGGDGVVAWIWQVNVNEATGPATLVVNCGPAGSAQFQFEVAR